MAPVHEYLETLFQLDQLVHVGYKDFVVFVRVCRLEDLFEDFIVSWVCLVHLIPLVVKVGERRQLRTSEDLVHLVEHKQCTVKQIISSLISILNVFLCLAIHWDAVDQQMDNLGEAADHIKDFLIDAHHSTLEVHLEQLVLVIQILVHDELVQSHILEVVQKEKVVGPYELEHVGLVIVDVLRSQDILEAGLVEILLVPLTDEVE
jgi:hypothetical protein